MDSLERSAMSASRGGDLQPRVAIIRRRPSPDLGRRGSPAVEGFPASPHQHLDLSPLLSRHLLAPAFGAAERVLTSAKKKSHRLTD
uniref:Uncharacterized protein n=1 Tax=Oryza brachyantha TaxID=4533 RepID=J3LKP2_ORYBR